MARNTLMTTTAIVLGLSLVAPVAAQDAAPVCDPLVEDCPEAAGEQHKKTKEERQQAREERQKAREERRANRDAAETETETEEAEAAKVEADSEAESAVETGDKEPAQEGTEASEQADADAEAAPIDAPAPADAEAPQEEATQDEPVQAEAGPEAEPEEAEEPVETSAQPDSAQDEEPAEPLAEPGADATVEREADVAGETDAEAETEVQTEVESESVEEPELTEEQLQAREERRAERRERRQAAKALAAQQAGKSEADAKVETEVVTEETSRSSDEDEVVRRVDDNDDTLSDIAKILGGAAAGFALNELLSPDDEVVQTTQDRVIVRRDGEYVVLKDENELLRRPGTEVQTQSFSDGSTRSIVTQPDGDRVVTVRAADGSVLYRTRVQPDGSEIVLIDETAVEERPVDVRRLRQAAASERVEYQQADDAALRRALRKANRGIDRNYSLRQVRELREVRELMPPIDLDNITFATNSAAIRPNQAEALAALGREIAAVIDENPDEMFLIEGHTDTVGDALYNLALSDRRAESVALALAEYFDVPPENLVVQGYGEQFLKVAREGDIRANRRATVRRITPLLRTARNQ
ncbi:OmpA family protein [Halovulum sp. GXIMD14794]